MKTNHRSIKANKERVVSFRISDQSASELRARFSPFLRTTYSRNQLARRIVLSYLEGKLVWRDKFGITQRKVHTLEFTKVRRLQNRQILSFHVGAPCSVGSLIIWPTEIPGPLAARSDNCSKRSLMANSYLWATLQQGQLTCEAKNEAILVQI